MNYSCIREGETAVHGMKGENTSAAQRMKRYITEHLREPITAMDIARAAGYSQYHAARVFKGETGLSPFEYIRRERLTASARALRAEAGAQDADLPAGMAGLYRDDAGHQHQIILIPNFNASSRWSFCLGAVSPAA